MLEDAGDQRRLCDGGDDTHFAPAARTGADVDRDTRRRRCIQLIAVLGLASRMSSPGCAVGAGLATM